MDAQVLEEILKDIEPDKKTREIEIKIIARLRKHGGNPKFTALGERLEKIKERHEQCILTSLEFLKAILEVAKEVVEAEKEVAPEEERDRAKEALTELFSNAKGKNTHIIVERIVADIDDIVKKVRFPDWQHTSQGERLVQKELRRTLLKYGSEQEFVNTSVFAGFLSDRLLGPPMPPHLLHVRCRQCFPTFCGSFHV
jgi:type I restriction enzyme R subunit